MKFTIEQARKYRGYSCDEMAKNLKMSTKTYINYEKYKRYLRIDTAYIFLNVVNMNFDDVIFFNKDYT